MSTQKYGRGRVLFIEPFSPHGAKEE